MKNLKAKQRTSRIGRRTGVNVVSGRKIREQDDGTDVFDDYWTESDTEHSTTSDESLASGHGRSVGVSRRKSRTATRSFTKSPKKENLQKPPTRKRKGEGFQDRSCNTSNTEISFRKDVSKVRRGELPINEARTTRNSVATDDDAANKSLVGVQKSPMRSVQKKRNEHFESSSNDSNLERSSTQNRQTEEFDQRSDNSSPEKPFGANVSNVERTELSENGSRAIRNAFTSDVDTIDKNEVRKSLLKKVRIWRSENYEGNSSDSSLERSSTQRMNDGQFEDDRNNKSSPEKSFGANFIEGGRAELSENGTRSIRNVVASDSDTADEIEVQKSPLKRDQKSRSENYEDGSNDSSLDRFSTKKRNDGEFEYDNSNNSSPEKSLRADVSKVRRAELSKNGIRESRNSVAIDSDTADKNVSGVRKSPMERVKQRKSVTFKDVSSSSGEESSPTRERKDEEFEDHGSSPEKSFTTDVPKARRTSLLKNKIQASRNAVASDGITPDKKMSETRKSSVARVQERRSINYENISSNSGAESSQTRKRKDEEIEDHANNSITEKSFRANVPKIRRAELSVNGSRVRRNVVVADDDTVDESLAGVRKSPEKRVWKRRSEQFEDAGSDSSLENSSSWNRKDEELENHRSNNSIREKSLRASGSRIRWTDLSERGTGVTRNAVASDGDTTDNNLTRVRKAHVEGIQKRRSGQFEDAGSDSSLEPSSTRERKDEELENRRSNNSMRERSFRAVVSNVKDVDLSMNGTRATRNGVATDGDIADKNLARVQKSPIKRVQKRRSENFEDGGSNSKSESSQRVEVSKRRSTPASAAENLPSSDNLVLSDNAVEACPTQVPKSSARKSKKKKKGPFGNNLRSGSSDGKSDVSTRETEQVAGTLEDAQTTANDLPGTSAPRSNTAQRRIDFSEASDSAEKDQQPHLRRSNRKRIPRIASWLNERYVPLQKESGDISIVYEKGTEEDCFAMNLLKKRYDKKPKKLKSRGKTKQPCIVPKTRIVDERTQKVHHLSIHRPFNLYDWTIPTTADGREPPYLITKGFSHPTISFGFLEIHKLSTKDPQYSPTDNLHFVVLEGVVDATISNVLRTHTKYDSFIVPTGSSYSLTNNCTHKAILSFCTFKTAFFPYQA